MHHFYVLPAIDIADRHDNARQIAQHPELLTVARSSRRRRRRGQT